MSTTTREAVSAGFSVVRFSSGSVGLVENSAITAVKQLNEDPPDRFEVTFLLQHGTESEPKKAEVSVLVSPTGLYMVGGKEFMLVSIEPTNKSSMNKLWFVCDRTLFIPRGFFEGNDGSGLREISMSTLQGYRLCESGERA